MSGLWVVFLFGIMEDDLVPSSLSLQSLVNSKSRTYVKRPDCVRQHLRGCSVNRRKAQLRATDLAEVRNRLKIRSDDN